MPTSAMDKAETRKQFIANQIADYLLVHGMKAASLRPLAAAVGTSDRMLLHYFANKEALMTAALTIVAARMILVLDRTRAAQMPFETLLPHLVGTMKDPIIRPYLRLWLELAALSAAEATYHTIARQICTHFFDWIASGLQVENEEERTPKAALAFATLEGFIVLDALDQGSIITNALDGIKIR